MQTGQLVENFVTSYIHAFVAAHVLLICTVLGIWVFVGSQLGRYWPMPPATAPKWKRFAHFVLVNWPEFGASLEGKTWMGINLSFPFVSWTKRATEIVDAVEKAREILKEEAPPVAVSSAPAEAGPPSVVTSSPLKKDSGFISLGLLMFIALIAFVVAVLSSGCVPTDSYVVALKVKGDLADSLYAAHAAWVVYDQERHAQLVANAASLEAGQAALDKWKADEHKVDDAFVLARKAIETYSIALKAVDAEQKKDFVTAIADVTAAVANLVDILRSLGVSIPGLDSVQKPVTVAESLLQRRVGELVFASSHMCGGM